MPSLLIGFTGAIAVGTSITLLVLGSGRRRAPVRALDELAIDRRDARTRRLAQPLPLRLAGAWATRLGKRLYPRKSSDNLHARLDRAGFGVSIELFHAAKAIGAGAGLAVGLAVGFGLSPGVPWSLAVVAGLGLLGAHAPEIYLSHATQRREHLVTLALPESLDLLALTVQAGLGLEQAIAEVAGEVPGPLGEEFGRLLKEQQLGRSREESLEALGARTTSEDLQRLVAALLHAERLGSSITATLQSQATELRRRRRARARERAGKAPVKLLFPLIFCILPSMFVIIMGPGVLSILDALTG